MSHPSREHSTSIPWLSQRVCQAHRGSTMAGSRALGSALMPPLPDPGPSGLPPLVPHLQTGLCSTLLLQGLDGANWSEPGKQNVAQDRAVISAGAFLSALGTMVNSVGCAWAFICNLARLDMDGLVGRGTGRGLSSWMPGSVEWESFQAE